MRKYIKEAREGAGLTQQQVAEKLHISQNYYCDIENGVRQKIMRTDILDGISRLLNIPTETILKEEASLREEKI